MNKCAYLTHSYGIHFLFISNPKIPDKELLGFGFDQKLRNQKFNLRNLSFVFAKYQIKDGKMVLNIGKLRTFVVDLRNFQLQFLKKLRNFQLQLFFKSFLEKKSILYCM